ncbi:MAG: RagB/SusD family nutrient uptake outer membrane protein [Saprospiraceae bacterium]|nr:RagB/SusD family nutrient uptake outer membrane protein [Saprospiraceae bacterium]
MLRFIKYSLALVAAVLIVSACDKKLDLEPAQSISEELALSTDANVKSVLLGAYDALGNYAFWGGYTMRDAELAGADGEIRWVGTFNGPREVFNHTMIAENPEAEAMWNAGYNAINIANNVLSALSVVKADDRDQVEGEALFIRAVCHFELVRFFAKPYEAGGNNTQPGIPLMLRPTREIDDASFVSRASVEDVYAQVVTDLAAAFDKLPEENGNLANKYAAAAMLARVHLQKGEYDHARDHANDVIGADVYSLVSDYASEFNNDDNTSEDIFANQISTQDGTNDMVTYYSIPEFGGRDGDIEIEQKHLDLYDPNDARLLFHYDGNGAIRAGKWRDQYRNIPNIRLAEMYLIRAECNQRLGTSVGAPVDDDYNATHTRAGLPAKSGVTLDDILLERRLELAHEGHKLHDVKRLKGTVDGLPYDDPKLVYPIPAREIAANPNLSQNQGY